MNYPIEYYNGLPISPQYAYYYPPVYDSYLPYWRYPASSYHEPRQPYMPFRCNYSDDCFQKESKQMQRRQNIKKESSQESEQNKSCLQLLPLTDKSLPCVKIETQNLNIMTSNKQADQKYVLNLKQEEKFGIQDLEAYQKLTNLFESYQGDLYEYNTLLKKVSSQNMFNAVFFGLIDKKIKSFKKSKEQMIKIIIRKTQRYYKNVHRCKKDQRFVKYGGFKSMNAVYLETMFSDPLFLEAFEIVALRFKTEFENENKKKIQLISSMLSKMKSPEDIECLERIISEKNKMAWPEAWLHKMNKTIYELYDNYGSKKLEIISALYRAIQK